MMRRRLSYILAHLSYGMILAGTVSATAQTRVWSVKLETVGWQDPYIDMRAQFKRESDDRVAAQADIKAGKAPHYKPVDLDLGVNWSRELAVDSAGQVYLGFAAKRENLDAPKALRVVMLSAQNGALVRQMDLPTPVWGRTAVMLAEDDTPLLVAGDRVQRVNKDGFMGNSVAIPPQPKINPGLWVIQSPSGKTLLLTTDEQFFRFVSPDTLATIVECRMKDNEVETINDSLGMGLADGSNHQFEEHAGPFCGPMPRLWPVGDGRSTEVRLLEDGSVIEVGTEAVRRLTRQDKPQWSWKSPEGTLPTGLAGIAISRNGERVAVEEEVFHTLRPLGCMECKGPEFESWGVGVAVLDTATGKQVGLAPLDHATLDRTAFAFSADGKKLAVMNAGVLEMWSF